MPILIHHTWRREIRRMVWAAKGTSLSVRMAAGSRYSTKRCSKTTFTASGGASLLSILSRVVMKSALELLLD